MGGRLVLALWLAASFAGAEEWDRFRGPNGAGVSSSAGFPIEIDRGRNVAWRAPARPGKSSPVLSRRHVFLTAFDDGKLYTQCFDRSSGALVWERALDRARSETVNAQNHPAAITPTTDGENVYAFFYEYGLVSYGADGSLRWKVPLGPFSNSMGHSSCPILAGGSVVLVLDQMVDSNIAAFDERSGELRWRTSREEMEGWATPLVYQPPGAPAVIVTASRGLLGAHRATDGKRLWSRPRVSPSVVASPVLDGDTLFTFGYGYDAMSPFAAQLEKLDRNHDGRLTPDEYGDTPYLLGIGRYGGNRDGVVTQEKWEARQRLSMAPSSLLSIRLGPGATAAGDGSALTTELWRYEKSFVGVVPSPLLYAGLLYVVRNGGVLTTFDAGTGEVAKAARLTGALGPYSASPVAAEGKIWLASEEGKVTVVKAARDWEVMAVNDLGEECFATPALADGQIYLRTAPALYRFGSRPQSAPARGRAAPAAHGASR